MAPKVANVPTNYAGIQRAKEAIGCFQKIVLFMNKSNLKIAITTRPLIDLDRPEQF